MSVYLITCRSANAVKIGCSVDPYGRLPEIQLGCPLPLRLEAVLPGAHTEEKAMHWRFSEYRIHGEWFAISEEIELVILANPAPPPRKSWFKQNPMQRAKRPRASRFSTDGERYAQAMREMHIDRERVALDALDAIDLDGPKRDRAA